MRKIDVSQANEVTVGFRDVLHEVTTGISFITQATYAVDLDGEEWHRIDDQQPSIYLSMETGEVAVLDFSNWTVD